MTPKGSIIISLSVYLIYRKQTSIPLAFRHTRSEFFSSDSPSLSHRLCIITGYGTWSYGTMQDKLKKRLRRHAVIVPDAKRQLSFPFSSTWIPPFLIGCHPTLVMPLQVMVLHHCVLYWHSCTVFQQRLLYRYSTYHNLEQGPRPFTA